MRMNKANINGEIDPRWITVWGRVRAAAEELRQLDAAQIDTENH